MIQRQPTRREARIPSRPRWILISLITLAPVVATADFVSLNASARSATMAFSERMTSGNRTAGTPGQPVTERPGEGHGSHATQWTFLREIGAKAAALVHVRTALSMPNVVGPTGALHR